MIIRETRNQERALQSPGPTASQCRSCLLNISLKHSRWKSLVSIPWAPRNSRAMPKRERRKKMPAWWHRSHIPGDLHPHCRPPPSSGHARPRPPPWSFRSQKPSSAEQKAQSFLGERRVSLLVCARKYETALGGQMVLVACLLTWHWAVTSGHVSK